MKKTVNAYFRRHKWVCAVWLIVTFGVSFVAPLKNFQLKWLIDASSRQEALVYIAITFAITLISFVLESISRKIYTKMACNALREVRASVMESALKRTYAEYSTKSDATYISLLTTDCRTLYDNYYMSIFEVIFWGGIMLVSLGMFVYLSPVLLIVTVIVSIPPVLLPRIMNKRLKAAQDSFSQGMAVYTQRIKELLGGYEIIRGYLCQDRFIQKHRGYSEECANQEHEFQQNMNTTMMSTSLMSNMIFAVMLLVGMFMVFNGDITLGTMTTATSLINFVISPCNRITQAYAKIKSSQGVRSRIESAMDSGEEPVSGKQPVPAGFEGVTIAELGFTYPNSEKQVLQDVSLSISKGEKVALLGESGCGKSTLAKIMYQYYPEYSGRIQLGTRELRQIDFQELYRTVGYMSQSTFLLNDTIRNNICLYQDFSESELNEAINLAGLRELMNSLPLGVDTVLQENGRNLSGGQRQRIGIARLVIRHYDLIIADEITANLDPDTTAQIMENILNLPSAMLLITHNVSSKYMKRFDSIHVVSNGKICEYMGQ